MPHKLWLVDRVFGKNKEHVEVVSGEEKKIVENILHRDIHPGNYLVLEDALIMDVLTEADAKKRI